MLYGDERYKCKVTVEYIVHCLFYPSHSRHPNSLTCFIIVASLVAKEAMLDAHLPPYKFSKSFSHFGEAKKTSITLNPIPCS